MTQFEITYKKAKDALFELRTLLAALGVAGAPSMSYQEIMNKGCEIAAILEKNRKLEEKCTQTPANHSNVTE